VAGPHQPEQRCNKQRRGGAGCGGPRFGAEGRKGEGQRCTKGAQEEEAEARGWGWGRDRQAAGAGAGAGVEPGAAPKPLRTKAAIALSRVHQARSSNSGSEGGSGAGGGGGGSVVGVGTDGELVSSAGAGLGGLSEERELGPTAGAPPAKRTKADIARGRMVHTLSGASGSDGGSGGRTSVPGLGTGSVLGAGAGVGGEED